jgi:uncharacterized phage infection (PIP) family protein YhgE
MSEPEARHAAVELTPDNDVDTAEPTPPQPGVSRRPGLISTKATRKVWIWTVPVVITLALMSALAAFYLGGLLNPTANLRHFPIAVLNEDAGPNGGQIVENLVSGLDNNKYDLRVLSRTETLQQLNTAQIYGVAVIPPNFSSKLQAFARSATTPKPADRPIIFVSTNPRAGTLGAGIAERALTRAVSMIDRGMGQGLLKDIAQRTGGAPMPGAVKGMLASPIKIEPTLHNPLPDGTGNGQSAFYYSLLLLLAGFTGSFVVSRVVDSMLGSAPAEFGPVNRFAEQVKISRFRTLLIKWALMAVLALLTSAIYIVIARGLGMPIQNTWVLWLYGAFAIVAVGVTSTSLIAVLGSLGLLVSMLVFVILGLLSAGATVPLEAAPPFFSWPAKFEPMYQVFLGTRSLLYLNGQADAGLSQALILTGLGLAAGLLFGGIVTYLYDRRDYHRLPPELEATSPSEPAGVTTESTTGPTIEAAAEATTETTNTTK